jgi:uroporphyrinogen-III synthase
LEHTWIITKSQPHADSLVIRLRRQGMRAAAVPCVEHQWHDWPELRRIGASGAALLFVTSRAAAARVEVPNGTLVAAIAPTTSATLQARGIRVALSAHGGACELARVVCDSTAIPADAEVFYPTSDVAQRQPEHQAAVSTLSRRFRVHSEAVYSTVAPANLAHELATLRAPASPEQTPHGFCFWSPSAVENFSTAGAFTMEPGPVVLIGGSTERCWQERAPSTWHRTFKHEAGTPLEWSLRFLERNS